MDSNPNQFYFFTRWGRVGAIGQMAESAIMDKEMALKNYRTKVNEKIKNGYKLV
jgi:predicted DNA-binding WGR domain protein